MSYWTDDQALNLDQRRRDADQAEALKRMSERPYRVEIEWQDGRTTIPFTTHDSWAVTAYAHNNIAHDPRVISRIRIYGPGGPLETVFSAA